MDLTKLSPLLLQFLAWNDYCTVCFFLTSFFIVIHITQLIIVSAAPMIACLNRLRRNYTRRKNISPQRSAQLSFKHKKILPPPLWKLVILILSVCHIFSCCLLLTILFTVFCLCFKLYYYFCVKFCGVTPMGIATRNKKKRVIKYIY